MADPFEVEVNPKAQVLPGEDLLELRLVLDALGPPHQSAFDVAVAPTSDPTSDGIEYHIVVHQP